MDSGRIFRALVMFLTLLGVLWAIRQISGTRHALQTKVAKGAAQAAALPAEIEVHSLPFVSLDNTCRSEQAVDLAGCTGLSTKGSGLEYFFELEETATIFVEVVPEYELFDPGFAVYDAHENCVVGREMNPAGMTERATLKLLAAGRYRLVIGGYGGDCGPFTLTVSPARSLVADVTAGTVARGKNGYVLNWRTFGEHGIDYFELQRNSGEHVEIVAKVRSRGGAARSEEYKFLDRNTNYGGSYVLIAVGRDGQREELTRLG